MTSSIRERLKGGPLVPPSLSVRVGMPGESDSSFRIIPRPEMNVANLERILGGTVEFLTERETGMVVWPARWLHECLPPPATYIAHIEVKEDKAPDILEQAEYRGEAMLLLRNVPADCSEEGLATWFRVGLEDEQPELVNARKGVEDLQGKLNVINRQLDELPHLISESAGSTEEELQQRQRRAKLLARAKQETEARLEDYESRLAIAEAEARGALSYTMTKVESTPPFGDGIWEVRFANSDRGEELAYLASRKRNWREYWLAQAVSKGSVAGRGTFRPLATRGGGFNDMAVENIVVERVRHGTGMYRFPAGDDKARGFYSGQWRHGEFHGIGTHISGTGRFQGHFRRGMPAGRGTLVSSHGDVYRGDWGFTPRHTHASLINGHEYTDGVPHGRGEFTFVDGSVYRGEMRDGAPSGKGRYTMPTGDVTEGQFDGWGCLSGEGSAAVDGVTLMGKWRRGFMHGFGTEIDTTLGTYDGDFESSLRHGYGLHQLRLVEGTQVGSYCMGDRNGYGLLDYTPLSPEEEVKRGIRSADSLPGSVAFGAGAGSSGSLGYGSPGTGLRPPPGAPSSTPVSPAAKASAAGPGWLNSPGASPVGKPSAAAATAALMSQRIAQSALKAKAALLASIPSSGEFRVEGRWRAGAIQAGGVLTDRSAAAPNDALAYTFQLASEVSKKDMPGLQTLMRQETAVLKDRQERARAVARALRMQRRTREKINVAKFAAFMRGADRAHEGIAAETAAARGYLGDLAASVAARRERAELERLQLEEVEDDGSPKKPGTTAYQDDAVDEEKKSDDGDGKEGDDEEEDGLRDPYFASIPSSSAASGAGGTGTGAGALTVDRAPTVAVQHHHHDRRRDHHRSTPHESPRASERGSSSRSRTPTASATAPSAAGAAGAAVGAAAGPSSHRSAASRQHDAAGSEVLSTLPAGAVAAGAAGTPDHRTSRHGSAAATSSATGAGAGSGLASPTLSTPRAVIVTLADAASRPMSPVSQGMRGFTLSATAAAEVTGVLTE